MQQAPGAETAPITANQLPPLTRANWPFPVSNGKPVPAAKRQPKPKPSYPAAPDAPF